MTTPLSALADTVWTTVLVPLLDEVPQPDEVRPGWVSTALMLSLIAVTVLLWFSLRKQLGKVKFDEDADREPEAGDSEGPESGPAETDGDPR